MATIIEKVIIKKLFGNISYEIELVDNCLILVGENGSGKSTVVSMIYLFLTKQWKKLREYHFQEMSVQINGRLLRVTKEELMLSPRRTGGLTIIVSQRLKELGITAEEACNDFDKDLFNRLVAGMPKISAPHVRHILEELCTRNMELFESAGENLASVENELDMRILYLPTYRRIERDFKAIFPALEEDIDRYNKKIGRYDSDKKHIELVEFGMEDVAALITNKMNSLNNMFRSSLYALTGGYLRVVLRKEYKKADVDVLKTIDLHTLDGIMSRIDESVLSGSDKTALSKAIVSLNKKKTTNDIDLISAHIISKLIILHEEQFEREKAVRTFANVCNKYLKNKAFHFDSNHFALPIRAMTSLGSKLRFLKPEEIKLSMLSSGEKQIVSLFAHLYLSDHSEHLIIIDEPELSLSVPWQSTFLPDILNTGRCNGLIAVTHSPFIYDNDLKNKAHSIQEFING